MLKTSLISKITANVATCLIVSFPSRPIFISWGFYWQWTIMKATITNKISCFRISSCMVEYCALRSADVLSGRHIVRETFCHGFLLDVLSGRHFVSTYFVRHFVRKTFCQFSFFPWNLVLTNCQEDKLSGSILTIFLVC